MAIPPATAPRKARRLSRFAKRNCSSVSACITACWPRCSSMSLLPRSPSLCNFLQTPHDYGRYHTPASRTVKIQGSRARVQLPTARWGPTDRWRHHRFKSVLRTRQSWKAWLVGRRRWLFAGGQEVVADNRVVGEELSERPARSQTTFTPSLGKHVLSPRWRLTTTRCSGEATRPECTDMRSRRSSSTAATGSLISFLGCLAAHRQESRRRQALNLARRARHVEAPAKDLSRPPGTLTKPPTSSYCLLMPLHDRGGPARSCSHRDSLWRGM